MSQMWVTTDRFCARSQPGSTMSDRTASLASPGVIDARCGSVTVRWTSSEIAILGMTTTVVVAILSALAAYLAAKRDRRRTLYSEAVQAIAGWKEMLYRVRRRQTDDAPELVAQFHELQDKLAFCEAWVGSESKYMARSYRRLVREVKGATESLIQEAWETPPRSPGAAETEFGPVPDLTSSIDRFLADVRSHLSPLPWRKLAIASRNPETGNS